MASVMAVLIFVTVALVVFSFGPGRRHAHPRAIRGGGSGSDFGAWFASAGLRLATASVAAKTRHQRTPGARTRPAQQGFAPFRYGGVQDPSLVDPGRLS